MTPLEYIYIDMHCQGTASIPTQGTGHTIVYGIKGSQNDVDRRVYDTAYVVENGKMAMQKDLDLNGYIVLDGSHYIHGKKWFFQMIVFFTHLKLYFLNKQHLIRHCDLR